MLLELKPKPCDSQPCENDGICTNVGDSFSCECVGNYQGVTCEGKWGPWINLGYKIFSKQFI